MYPTVRSDDFDSVNYDHCNDHEFHSDDDDNQNPPLYTQPEIKDLATNSGLTKAI